MITFLKKRLLCSQNGFQSQRFNNLVKQKQALRLISSQTSAFKPQNQISPNSLTQLQSDEVKAYFINNLTKCQGLNLIAEVNQKFDIKNIPFSVKGHLKVQGIKYTLGFAVQQIQSSKESAEVVKILQGAGFQPICTGNVPQGLFGIQVDNNKYGRAQIDKGFAVGGSSGGDAGLVRCNAVPFSVVSDSAGSIRIPASINGIFGFKPTSRRLSRVGRINPSGHQLDILKQIEPGLGFISKSITMIKQLCQLTLGRSSDDFYNFGEWNQQKFTQKKKYRVGYMIDTAKVKAVPAVRNSINQVIILLKEAGYEVEQVKLQGIDQLNEIFFKMNMPLLKKSFYQKFKRQKPAPANREFNLFNCSEVFLSLKIWFSSIFFSEKTKRLSSLKQYSFAEFLQLVARKESIKKSITKEWVTKDLDFIITPVLPFTSIKSGSSELLIRYLMYGVLFNTLDSPVLAIPARRVKSQQTYYQENSDQATKLIAQTARQSVGHHVGFQLCGKPYHDQQVISFGTQITNLLRNRI